MRQRQTNSLTFFFPNIIYNSTQLRAPFTARLGEVSLDKWKYYDIRHKRHLLCNPLNREKFEKLCGLLKLERGSRVLDIACGKGEFLIRLAELYGISGVGVDISPYCIRDCLEKKRKRVPNSSIKFIEMFFVAL